MKAIKGLVFDIKRGVSKDGPGLRTSVFLKGCPLRCVWCHNPESQAAAIQKDKLGVVCGRELSVEEVMAEVRRDAVFYESSGGGLTITGGEPLMQADFVAALAAASKAEGISVAIDTCGFAPWASFEQVLPFVDLFLYDLKCMDDFSHTKLTAHSNKLILENLHRLDETGVPIYIRCPLIPGLNDSMELLLALKSEIKALKNCQKLELCPYHSLGVEKYERFGLENSLKNQKEPTRDDVKRWREVLVI